MAKLQIIGVFGAFFYMIAAIFFAESYASENFGNFMNAPFLIGLGSFLAANAMLLLFLYSYMSSGKR